MNKELELRIAKFIEKIAIMQLVSIDSNGFPACKMVNRLGNNGVAEFYAGTRMSSECINNLKQNNKAGLYLISQDFATNLTVKCEVELITENAEKAKFWDDEYKNFGYTGYDDPAYVVVKLNVKSGKLWETMNLTQFTL